MNEKNTSEGSDSSSELGTANFLHALDVDTASDVTIFTDPPTATSGRDPQNEFGHHDIPVYEPSVTSGLSQSHEDSVVRRPLDCIDHDVHKHQHLTHLDPSHPHPIIAAHSGGPLYNGLKDGASGGGADHTIPDNPPRRRRESSSIPYPRPLGPRGPLLSYAQLYGERSEGDTSSDEHSSAFRSTLHDDEAELDDRHGQRQAMVAEPFREQNNHIGATRENGPVHRGSPDGVIQEEDETESIDRCTGVTPPPPYEGR